VNAPPTPPPPPTPTHPDSRGVWAATAALPGQLEDALAAAERAAADLEALAARAAVDAVVLLARGTDALAADAVVALAAPHAPVPVLAPPGPGLPGFAGPRTLVVAMSASGRDAETARSARTALERGCRAAVVAADGPLSSLAVASGVPCLAVPPSGTPRTQLGGTVVSVLSVLSRAGLIPDCAASVKAAAAALDRRCDTLAAPGGPAAEVARRIGRTIPVVYGAEGIGAVAARRWKAQVNLNAKSPAFWAAVPPAARDELAGWGQGGDVTRQVMSLVLLRHAGEDPAAAATFDAVVAAVDEVMADVVEVRAEGEDDLGRVLDLVAWGDFVSLFLAAREGVDPGPVPVIEDLGVGSA
jgi:glucose/mannose-6-phosphate isomerase